ncbi:hypothetical protein ACLB2K_010255 [Fragaria x ananassa]
MENRWMNKCYSTLPPAASSSSSQEQRNQMENAGYLSCQRGSQDLRPAMLGWLQDPLLSSIQSSGSHRSEHVNLGNSFLSLLSGSPSLLQRGFQDFSNSQPICTSGKILPVGNNSILYSTQSTIPLSSTGLPSEKLSWTNLQSGTDFCHNGSSKVVPSSICASNSVLHDLQSSDLAKVVICHTGPVNEKLESSYALSREWHCAGPASRANIQNSERMPLEANSFISNQAYRVCHSASPADSWKARRESIHTSQTIPLEANSFISYHASSLWHGTNPADNGKACRANIETSPKMPQASSFMNGCPRVFCSTTSGYLLFSNTGFLGIVCSCHSFRMSAFKFCEHSGLYGVNPGDAIRMDSGETISQWCKLNLPKFGVQMGTVNSEASMILSPQFSNSHLIPKDKTVSLDHKRKLSGEVTKNNAYHTSQWRDVPSKVKGVSDVTRVDRLANLFDATREDREKLGDTCVKCFNGTVQIADSMKEHEVSNISSGCSAPVVSQPSIEFNNMESSTNDPGDHGCGSNFVVDEGSGIDKAWSSDDALESERSAKFLASTGSSLKKVGPPKNLNHESSSCLLDDLKLLNSLTWQKGRDQIPAGLALRDKDKHLQNLEQGLKIGKRKRELALELNASCSNSDSSRVRQENHNSNGTSQFTSQPSKSLMMLSTSRKSGTHVTGNCITQSSSKPRLHMSSSAKKLLLRSDLHKLHDDKESEVNNVFQTELNGGANNHELPEVSGGKTCKRDCSSNAFRQFQIQESSRKDTKRTKYNSVDGFKSTCSQQVKIGHRKARPIVCGIYGELTDGSSTGRMSKPAKLVPLSRVLNSSRKCILPKHCNSKSSSMRKKKLGGAAICNTYDLKTEKYKCHDAMVKVNDTSMRKKKKECSPGEREIHKELFSMEKQGDVQSEKDHQKLDSITHTQLQMKPKEIRKRSIYEFTEKGEDTGFKSSSVSKISNFRPAKDGKLVNTGEDSGLCQHSAKNSTQEHRCLCNCDSDPICCVCGSSNQDEINILLECNQCSVRVHQACYGVSKVPKGCWSCRPCRMSSKDIVCVLCGYGGGAMTQALRSQTIAVSILRAWNIETESGPKNELCSIKTLQKDSTGLHCSGYRHSESSSLFVSQQSGQPLAAAHCKRGMSYRVDGVENSPSVSKTKVHNSITMGLVDSATKQWVHMVCGLWTPETRCPNVDTMSAFDVSCVPLSTDDVVCCMCKRAGGSCIQCRVENCSVRFHPWCAHQKGLLQTEVEGVDNENVGFYGRCGLHATNPIYKSEYPVDTEAGCLDEKKLVCARTEGYKGRKRDGFRHNYCDRSKGSDGCLVPQEQLNAWAYINGQKSCTQELPKLAISEIEHDSRKEYTRYKQAKLWKHLVVYKSGIHALGLYTSRFISRDEMVVEYVGEIVGQRVSDKRENEYQSAKKLQYKSACYFFRIDKEHIIDATCKGGIARFVNHSCSPNCVAKVISVRNEKKVVFLAERDIFPGEEITYDYHFNHEDEGKKIPCFCNSKNCRRYLN